jgi:hypothetical protein
VVSAQREAANNLKTAAGLRFTWLKPETFANDSRVLRNRILRSAMAQLISMFISFLKAKLPDAMRSRI